MTSKQFRKAAGMLTGTYPWSTILTDAMCVCLAVPVIFGNYIISSVCWAVAATMFFTWEYYQIEFDPSYPVPQSKKGTDLNLFINEKVIELSSVLPAARETAVRAYHNSRLVISAVFSAGLAAQGICFCMSSDPVYSTPLVLAVILGTAAYTVNMIAPTIKKGIKCAAARRLTAQLMMCFSFPGVFMLNDTAPDDNPMGIGVIMLANAVFIFIVNLICRSKCLKDAKNTARNGDTIKEK